jgi:hypothetical protein
MQTQQQHNRSILPSCADEGFSLEQFFLRGESYSTGFSHCHSSAWVLSNQDEGAVMKRVGVLLLVLATVLFLSGIACANSPLFAGKGCWVQDRSEDNPHIFSDVFSWYVVSGSNMDDELVGNINKPIFMAVTMKNPERVKEKIDLYAGRIVGVIWDYEFAGTPPEVAEASLTEIYNYTHQKGLLFGVTVVASPEQSRTVNGIDYKRAAQFADFLMPMLYCQWWGCKASQTAATYQSEVKATNLPLVAAVALETVSTSIKDSVLTPENLLTNYATLTPSPPGFCFWSVANLDDSYLQVIDHLP